MNSGDRLVTVIMPAFNAGKYISMAIDSVIKQTFSNWELIIVNNGSTDHTDDIVSSYGDERIKYFQLQENEGVSSARIRGLREMNGDFFCFLDADDVFPPNSLKYRLEVFRQNNELTFVDGSVDYYDETLTRKVKTWTPNFRGNPLYDLLHLTGNSFFGNTWMIRRNREISYTFDTELTHSEDLMFCISQSISGGQYDYTSETILKYRTGHHSAMKDLRGLESGYRKVYNEISRDVRIPEKWKRDFRKISKSIVFKSYLGNRRFLDAFRVLLMH